MYQKKYSLHTFFPSSTHPNDVSGMMNGRANVFTLLQAVRLEFPRTFFFVFVYFSRSPFFRSPPPFVLPKKSLVNNELSHVNVTFSSSLLFLNRNSVAVKGGGWNVEERHVLRSNRMILVIEQTYIVFRKRV